MTIDWPKVAGRMRADLDRAALNERPRMVLAVLIKVTLLRRRTVVVLPDRSVLCGLLGIATQHMGGVWREIESARIATFRKVELGWEVVLQPDASQWACDWVCTREQLDQWVQQIEKMPGQAQGSLLPPDPNLRKAIAENGAEQVSNQNGYSKPPAVTILVTPLRTLSVQGSKPDRAFNIERSKPTGQECELVDRCRALFGDKIMETYGANWRLRARENPGKLARILDETKSAMMEQRIKSIPAAFANDLWGRWK